MFLLTLTARWVIGTQAIETFLAEVTTLPLHKYFTAALSGNEAGGEIGVAVTDPTILGASWVTVAS